MAMTFILMMKERFATEPDKYKKYILILKLYENRQIGLSQLTQHVSEILTGHLDLWERFQNFVKPVQPPNNDHIDKCQVDDDTFMNSSSNLGLSDYDEYLISQVSETVDGDMMDLGSQTQPLQELVKFLTPDVAPVSSKEEDVAPVSSKEEDIGVDGKPPAKENILLVYPFVGGQAIEESAKGLFQYEEKRRSNPMLSRLQTEAVHPRNTSLVISKDDRKLLNPKGWLNDTLIDFWLHWITRMEFRVDSCVHVFSTHFYTKLEDEGVNEVLSWTTNRGINVFTKKFIYVPIHRNQHWSLMVIINPGLIDFCDDLNVKSEIPVMLHLDGLGLHDKKEIAANLRCWLNAEYDRTKTVSCNIFTSLTMTSISLQGELSCIFVLVSILILYGILTSMYN